MEINWETLRQLRQRFLDGTVGDADYWESPDVLEQYDATFAQRIGWKWGFVLNDLTRLGWTPPVGNIVDWGCGSGIASRAFIDHFGHDEQTQLWLSDRSPRAVPFAEKRGGERYPDLRIRRGVPDKIDVLLISHVLTEMSQTQIAKLSELASTAGSVIWVEPGTYEASLTLIGIRERLRETCNIVAPCTHQIHCGILAPGNESHWCHFFAHPPGEIFTDGFWSKFGNEMEIDLRSLPLSYLVLDHRLLPMSTGRSTRILGRPNLFKPYAELLGCSGDGVCARRLMKRTHPDVYRKLKKGRCPSRVEIAATDGRITDWKD